MSWFLAFLGFALLIIFHELGHFAAAKWVGMRVEKFSLFFGKPIAKITRGETTYSIGTIPAGGYVKITGMSPDEARALPPELYARSYAGSPVWKRIFVIFAGPFVNIVIAFVILMGIFWSQGKYVPGIVVSQVESTYSAAGKLKTGDRVLSITAPNASGSPTTALGDDAGIKTTADEQRRLKGLIAVVTSGGCGAKPLGTKDVSGAGQVAPCAAPASLQVAIDRAGVKSTVAVTPKYDTKYKRYRLGIGFDEPKKALGPISASGESVTQMWVVTRESVKAIVKLFYNTQARKQVSGIIGGYETTRQSIEVSFTQTMFVIALISLSLAVINLFPFLPLDGGHIFWALVEKLRRGRPVRTAVLERASMVGIALVLVLFVIGASNDIARLLDGTGFGIR